MNEYLKQIITIIKFILVELVKHFVQCRRGSAEQEVTHIDEESN